MSGHKCVTCGLGGAYRKGGTCQSCWMLSPVTRMSPYPGTHAADVNHRPNDPADTDMFRDHYRGWRVALQRHSKDNTDEPPPRHKGSR